jgi:hypothetical protein
MNDKNKIIYTLILLINITPYLYVFYNFKKISFDIDDIIGFYPIFGFLACISLIVIAKAIAVILKKGDTYYD